MRASRNWDDQRVMDPNRVRRMFGVEIQPCPFCECEHAGLYLGPSPHVTCGGCGADGPAFEGAHETIEQRQWEAVKAWNGSMPRRPSLIRPTSE